MNRRQWRVPSGRGEEFWMNACPALITRAEHGRLRPRRKSGFQAAVICFDEIVRSSRLSQQRNIALGQLRRFFLSRSVRRQGPLGAPLRQNDSLGDLRKAV